MTHAMLQFLLDINGMPAPHPPPKKSAGEGDT